MPDIRYPPESASRRSRMMGMLDAAEDRLKRMRLDDPARSRVVREIIQLTDMLDALDDGIAT